MDCKKDVHSRDRSLANKPHCVRISRSQSVHKSQQIKRRKSSIIHVRLRPHTHNLSRKIQPISSMVDTSATSCHAMIQTKDAAKQTKNKCMRISNNISQNEKLWINTSSQLQDNSSTWGTVDDTHRPKDKKKIKCSPRNIVLVTIVSLIVTAVIAGVITIAVLLGTQKKAVGTPKDAFLRWNPVGITVAGVTTVSGNTSDKLCSPLAVKLDYENALYINDYCNHRIQRYLPHEVTGTTVAGLANGTCSVSSIGLCWPQGIAVDSQKNLYIANAGLGKIVLRPVGGLNWTQLISNLFGQYDVFYDEDARNLYVTGYGLHQILCHDLKTSTTTVVAGSNGSGTNSSQLILPTGVFFDELTQTMIITNYGANNIVRWRLGASSWTLLAGNANGSAGSSSTELLDPLSTVLDPMGNAYVADRGNARIQLFMAGQSTGITIAGITGLHGSNASLLKVPWFAALDSQLNLYVADTDNHRVQKFLRY